nr:AI-2E family transporter [Caldimonas mangrovi]
MIAQVCPAASRAGRLLHDGVSASPPFSQRLLLTLVVVAGVLLAWNLREVIVLVFAGSVVAVTLTAFGRPLRRYFGLSRRVALAAVLAALVAVLGLGIWLIGPALSEQFERLREELPRAVDAVGGWLDSNALGAALRDAWNGLKADGVPWSRVASLASVTLGSLATFGLVIVLGIYLAADPTTYRRGVVRLLPPERRGLVDGALGSAGESLHRWLVGQGVSMLAVGMLTTLALWAIGMPLALALGVIAAVLDFVPFFGPIVAGALSVLLAFIEGPQTALQVAIAVIAIQQVEGNVLMPLVQRWAVALPPVLALLSVVIFGVLFGLPGVLLATPMMVVAMSLVDSLYLQTFIETPSSRGPD